MLTCRTRQRLCEDTFCCALDSAAACEEVLFRSRRSAEEKVCLLLYLRRLPAVGGPEPAAGCRTLPPVSCISGISCPCTPRVPSTASSAPWGEFTVTGTPQNCFKHLQQRSTFIQLLYLNYKFLLLDISAASQKKMVFTALHLSDSCS